MAVAISIHLTVLREYLSSLPGNPMHMIQERRVPPLETEISRVARSGSICYVHSSPGGLCYGPPKYIIRTN
uniref:Uncharacterized protein n=1 Tax=Utricularia reniformis TaxID=192314 RepID=A0A1Y0AZF0_9LAMI|nr:hypothetical protein AEK19_MT0279 [Utricularia reniformis]ART30555.1 hypothetical protein AEK19_MT0279 [Utricularia reniformis]